MANKSAVTAAPAQTSRQRILTRGMILVQDCKNRCCECKAKSEVDHSGHNLKVRNNGPHHLPSAAIAALNTSETIIKKPIPSIIPKDSSRDRTTAQTPPFLSRSGTRQIRSNASWSSLSTVVAPISSNTVPTIVPAFPSSGELTLSSRLCTARAPSSPIKPLSCPKISPRTASSPKTSPAVEMTINSNGAMENMV